MKIVRGDVVRGVIAHLMRSDSDVERNLGSINLRDHQVDGVSRILEAFNNYGGALLCDEVGLGKTYTAAAVAKRAGPAIVVAPAALIEMWRESIVSAGGTSRVVSLEKFSRSEVRTSGAPLVIIDEAHHLRNPNTKRFRNVAGFIAHSKVLLLSATPLHNTRADLVALLSLFLGSRAATLDPADESRCVIRRRRNSISLHGMPLRVHCEPATPTVSEQVRRLVLALPPPVPPRDGDACAPLVQFTLLRQWASSTAALMSALRSRVGRADALIAALEAGTFPTRRELASWITPDSDVQLGFAELLASPGGGSDLLAAVRVHRSASEQLLFYLRSIPSTDIWRADHLRTLRTRYKDRKIVAFTQFASTARELYRELRADGRVGLITSGRSEIASGPLSRHEVIRRFAPIATGNSQPPDREAVTMLIATDLCSEGLNLQDAGVLIHLDLPWTPARIEQRIGRIARTGSRYREIFIHAFRIPKIVEDLLRLEQRLNTKRYLSETIVGACDETSHSTSIADAGDRIRQLLEVWAHEPSPIDDELFVACVNSVDPCFVAVIGNASRREMICGFENAITSDPRQVLLCMSKLESDDPRPSASDIAAIIARVGSWLEQQRLETQLQVADRRSANRRLLSRRINQAAGKLPPHQRATNASQVDRARQALRGLHNIGIEAQMMDLTSDLGAGHKWLEQLANIAEVDGNKKAEPDRSGFKLLALLAGMSLDTDRVPGRLEFAEVADVVNTLTLV